MIQETVNCVLLDVDQYETKREMIGPPYLHLQ